jgi:hypothetical protein
MTLGKREWDELYELFKLRLPEGEQRLREERLIRSIHEEEDQSEEKMHQLWREASRFRKGGGKHL